MSATPPINTDATHQAPAATPPPGDHTHRRRSRRGRRRHTIFFDLTETSDPWFDRVIEILLITLLIFAPIAMGAVQAWSELVVILIAVAMALVLGIKLIRRTDVQFIWSWSYLPIALFVTLAALQVTPLRMSIVRTISPGTAALKTSLISPLPNSERYLQTTTLSLYPEATWHDLRLLLAIAGVYVVTLNVIRRQRQIERILTAVAGVGAAVAVIGFVHLAFGITHVYGIVGELPSGWPIAPFINRNHFGQFMNLSLGAALALLFVHSEQMFKSQRKLADGDEQALPQISGTVLAIAGAIVLMSVGVFLSLSRGAMLAMTVSGGAAALIARRHGNSARVWLLALPGLVVALLVVWFGFEVIFGRFSQAIDVNGDASVGGRLQMVRDTLTGWKQFAVLGSGLGSFEVLFPMLDRSNVPSLATHAENEYVQVLLEAGALGLAMAIWFMGIVGIKFARAVRSAPSPMASIATGLGFGLLAILLQSFSDFGQHAPANAIVTAVVCAMLVTLAEASGRTKPPVQVEHKARQPVRIGAALSVGLAGALIVPAAVASSAAQSYWYAAREIDQRLRERDWQGTNAQFARLIEAAEAAVQRRPEDIHYHYWRSFYRWKAISRDRDPQTGQIRFIDLQLGYAERISQELLSGVRACPTYGPTYLLAGQIRQNILGDTAEGAALIRTALRLSRTDPGANFEAAILDARDGEWESAMVKLRHAVDLAPFYLRESVVVLTRDFHRADLAMELAQQSVPAFRLIVSTLDAAGDQSGAQAARLRLETLIEARAAKPEAAEGDLIDAAELLFARKDYAAATAAYRRALQIDSTRGDWHLAMAKSLAGEGKTSEALEEAHLAQRLGAGGAPSLIIELRLNPSTVPAR